MWWFLDQSHWIIGALASLHLVGFLLLYAWRGRLVREIHAFLSNLVRGFARRGDEGVLDLDDQIDSFITDIEHVLEQPGDDSEPAELKRRLEIKDETRPYLRSVRPETLYNVARTGIEAYPLLGILCTILAMGVGMPARPSAQGVEANAAAEAPEALPAAETVSASGQIVRAFGAAIWSTAAGLISALVLMLVNALIGPALERLIEHRRQVRQIVFAARKRLGIEQARLDAGAPATEPA
jgi:hypothetical protein